MAMANGRIIVATRAGGLGPLLDASKVGVAIQEATSQGVVAAITEVIHLGTVELTRQSQAGAEYVNVECGWPKFARETSEIYAMYKQNPERPVVIAKLQRQ